MTYKQKIYNIDIDKKKYQFVDVQIDRLKSENLALIDSIINDSLEINQIVDKIKANSFSDLVIIAIGGSSLSSKVFVNYNSINSKIKIHYLENIEYERIEYILNNINFQKTVFLVISKSGNSFETVAIFDILLQKIAFKYANFDFNKHLYCIVEFSNNIIYNNAKSINANLIQHRNIGGRFSAFTNVGLLASMLCGLNIDNIKAGAKNSLKNLFSENSHVREFVASLLTIKSQISNIIIMPYSDKLTGLTELFRQIWSESLGKDNFHIVPIDATGTIDQHSQLELYLGGMPNKMFNIITLNRICEKEPKLRLGVGSGKTVNELMSIEAHSTIKSLIDAKLVVRHIEINDYSEYDLGNLIADFMFEIILVARTLGINPFDQPKVEANKILIAKNLVE